LNMSENEQENMPEKYYYCDGDTTQPEPLLKCITQYLKFG